MVSIFSGNAITINRSQETKPTTFKKDPSIINKTKLNVNVDKEARTKLINQIKAIAAINHIIILKNIPIQCLLTVVSS